MEIIKVVFGLLAIGLIVALIGIGLYLGYQSYLAFKAGEILQAIYLIIAAGIFVRGK